VEIRARLVEVGERKTSLRCELSSDGELRAEASVLTVRVDPTWGQGSSGR
jgi:acyl-CoA thioesterase FadM